MGMVAPQQSIASAFVVCFGHFGSISQYARGRGVCRQRVYREAAWAKSRVDGSAWQAELEALRQENDQLRQRLSRAEQRLAQAVVLDQEKQAEFAAVGQAVGVSLPAARTLLEVLLSRRIPSVAKLGRWTQAVGRKAGELLAVLDEITLPRVQQAIGDEIYVSQPVLMMVEPESLCWVVGQHLNGPLTAAAWTPALARLPALEQVARDGGNCLGRALADLNQDRQERGLVPVADQLDHFHVLREGGRGIGRAKRAARAAFTAVHKAEARLAKCRRHGQSPGGAISQVRACWAKAERAVDHWSQCERVWQQVQAAVQPITAEGELNTRARAEKLLAEWLPQLPTKAFAKVKRQLARPQVLTYLDEIERKLAALDAPDELKRLACRQEALRRRPELLQAETTAAAVLRAVQLVASVTLALAGDVGQRTVQAVRSILRSSWRASSLVECVNSVLRMQQARHRKMSQSLVDLKRLYWNCHVFRTGRRRGQSPYQRLGVGWPEGVRWWDVLKWSPEQLRQQLSALTPPG